MIINDKRALAYVVTIDEIRPIEGYDPAVMREGIVLRDPTTDFSFKNVSREYLLKHEQ
jgi:hypothetical protein